MGYRQPIPKQTDRNGRHGDRKFYRQLQGLFPNTLYYVRAYAGTDTAHIWYGNSIQFTTASLRSENTLFPPLRAQGRRVA